METAFRSEERFTRDQFAAWLDCLPASAVGFYELIDGRIVVTPPARWPHGIVESTLSRLIGAHVARLALGRVFGSSTGYDLRVGPRRRDVLEPDLSFIARERWRAGPRPSTGAKGFLPIVPSVVVEVLSPATAKRDRSEKRSLYARAGVDEYWLVDPARREVAVHHRTGRWFAEPCIVRSGRVPSRELPALRLDVAALFADLD